MDWLAGDGGPVAGTELGGHFFFIGNRTEFAGELPHLLPYSHGVSNGSRGRQDMQYFFDIRRDGHTACDDDPEGAEFADMQAVRSEGLACIREILSERLNAGVETSDGELIVKDESRETVLTIPFSMRVRIGEAVA